MYITLAEYTTKEILPLIPTKRISFVLKDQVFKINLSSLRLQVFKKNLLCVSCGKEGNVFRLQSVNVETPHLNLYCGNILMTKDHIYPRSLGGLDIIDNLQTMCLPCNMKKSNYVISKLEYAPENCSS